MTRRLLAGLAWVVIAACSEQPYRHYASVSEAVAAGERERGWLPVWLPGSASDVHIQSDLDSNDWWIRARLSKGAADSLRRLLTRMNAESVQVQHPRSGSRWWFKGLIQQQPANDAALDADLFRGTGAPVASTIVVAFDRTSPTVFMWTRARAD